MICDADGDGYTLYKEECIGTGLGTDCDDHNKNVNPGVDEICGNGIDDNCNGEIDEGCIVKSPLSYNSQIRVPILSIIAYDVTVANLGTYDLQGTKVELDLPSNWEYGGVAEFGTLKKGTSKHARFRVLVSEDVKPTQEISIVFSDKNGVIERGTTVVRVEIPPFAVRIKPSLDNYEEQADAEVFVLLNNKEGKAFEELEVELNINQEKMTDYVQYLGVFALEPYERFRYRYTYPVKHLESPAIAVGYLNQDGKLVATSDDTLTSVYHPTRFDKDARTLQQIKIN
ncbi:hypothetical protein GOV07_03345 [Candidatus Woesearchaeota archaeon]|nr:hypothetical protein [Candidatus Woesearchaeota archaeon]